MKVKYDNGDLVLEIYEVKKNDQGGYKTIKYFSKLWTHIKENVSDIKIEEVIVEHDES